MSNKLKFPTEHTFRGDKCLRLKLPETYEEVVERVGIQPLVDCYLAYQTARAGASHFDKKEAGDEITLDWSGDDMPIYGRRRPSSAPTKADIATAERLWELDDDQLKEKLSRWHEFGIDLHYDAVNDSHDPIETLARGVRAVRIEVERRQKNDLF